MPIYLPALRLCCQASLAYSEPSCLCNQSCLQMIGSPYCVYEEWAHAVVVTGCSYTAFRGLLIGWLVGRTEWKWAITLLLTPKALATMCGTTCTTTVTSETPQVLPSLQSISYCFPVLLHCQQVACTRPKKSERRMTASVLKQDPNT